MCGHGPSSTTCRSRRVVPRWILGWRVMTGTRTPPVTGAIKQAPPFAEGLYSTSLQQVWCITATPGAISVLGVDHDCAGGRQHRTHRIPGGESPRQRADGIDDRALWFNTDRPRSSLGCSAVEVETRHRERATTESEVAQPTVPARTGTIHGMRSCRCCCRNRRSLDRSTRLLTARSATTMRTTRRRTVGDRAVDG